MYSTVPHRPTTGTNSFLLVYRPGLVTANQCQVLIGCPLVNTIFVVLSYRPILSFEDVIMDHGQFMTNGFLWPDPRAAFPPAKVLSLPWQLGGSLGHAPEYHDANISCPCGSYCFSGLFRPILFTVLHVCGNYWVNTG
jgi:hypothetical protein